MLEDITLEEKLRSTQEQYDTIEKKWNELMDERTRLIAKWREKYEVPVDAVMRARWELKKDAEDYKEKYDSLTNIYEQLNQIRCNGLEAGILRKTVNRSIKDVAKFLPIYMDISVKFRLVRREYMETFLGKSYN